MRKKKDRGPCTSTGDSRGWFMWSKESHRLGTAGGGGIGAGAEEEASEHHVNEGSSSGHSRVRERGGEP